MKKDDIWKARNADLKTYFSSKKYKLKKEPRDRWRVCGYGGLILYGCTYYHFSTDTSGNAVDCLVNVFKYDFKDAVQELLGYSVAIEPAPIPPKGNQTPEDFHLPELNKNQHRAFAYLNKARKIDKGIIAWLLHHKLLLQDVRGNCVFPFYNINGLVVGAEIVGTLDQIRFKQIAPGSILGYGYSIRVGQPARAYFFESAIDLLSYLTIYKDQKFNDSIFISLGGLKKETIYKARDQFENIELFMCLDNDDKSKPFLDILKSEDIDSTTLFPTLKDWNDDLRSMV